MKLRKIDDLILDLEYHMAKLKTVVAEFPNANYHADRTFSDESVNQIYTGFKFHYDRTPNNLGRHPINRSLYVSAYYELPFTFKDQESSIFVYSSPKNNLLARRFWNGPKKKPTIRFTKSSINLKNNNFKGDMLRSCREEILNFIQEVPGCTLEMKHLDPRLKKVLSLL